VEFIDSELDYLRKEIRSLSPDLASQALSSLLDRNVYQLTLADCRKIAMSASRVCLPDEDASRVLAENFFSADRIDYDSVFLRWHRDNVKVNQVVVPDRIVSISGLERELMSLAVRESNRSSNWWRQVGAVATTADGQILFAGHNHHLPSPYTPYLDGDPRNTAHRGDGLELYTAIHAEADIVARAAGIGRSLQGAHFYVSTFPCPSCARLLAVIGIAKLYCFEDYALLDGADILRQAGVEIIKVEPDSFAPVSS
ncbi:MAG: deaminase, partial [Candidatus Paceibacterota bacterium]